MKTMGDGVLFVGSVEAVVGAALGLTAHRRGPADLVIHAGVAFGEVLPAGGDYFGPIVNLAARLCSAAARSETLLEDAAAQVWQRSGAVAPAGERELKGFAAPVSVWVAWYRTAPDLPPQGPHRASR